MTVNQDILDSNSPVPEGFHVMAKPAGPACNLSCDYCFYCEKEIFFPEDKSPRMSDEILEVYTREYIKSQPGTSVEFQWQGGEPTLAGLDFFQRALNFQKKYNAGKQISNALQTNGTLLDDECAFLEKNNFLVGLSLDGPEFTMFIGRTKIKIPRSTGYSAPWKCCTSTGLRLTFWLQ